MENRYPKLTIDMNRLKNNFDIVNNMCSDIGIETAFVIKGYNGIPEISEEVAKWGCVQIASSRIEQLKDLKLRGLAVDTLLLRLPMMSEIEDVVRYADISLNSQKETLIELNRVAIENNIKHGVILMRDLGDLREGIFDRKEFTDTACFVEKELEGLVLEGVGGALSCYGSIYPTVENISELVDNGWEIERLIGRKLRYISGGSSTSLNLVHKGKMPEGVNHLRLAESIICTLDLPENWDTNIKGLDKNVFTLEAQVIEIQNKPSYPIGSKGVNAFGEEMEYTDRGIRLRALLAIGNRDVGSHTSLVPVDEGVDIIGASSDHLILDIEEAVKDYNIGDILKFNMYYQAILFASDQNIMNVEIINKQLNEL
jgi:predicted amino acid racemase